MTASSQARLVCTPGRLRLEGPLTTHSVGSIWAEALAALLWPTGGELDLRLRPHLSAGSRLLITALPAISDMHRQLASVA